MKGKIRQARFWIGLFWDNCFSKKILLKLGCLYNDANFFEGQRRFLTLQLFNIIPGYIKSQVKNKD